MQKKPTSMRRQNNFLSKAVEAATYALGRNWIISQDFHGALCTQRLTALGEPPNFLNIFHVGTCWKVQIPV